MFLIVAIFVVSLTYAVLTLAYRCVWGFFVALIDTFFSIGQLKWGICFCIVLWAIGLFPLYYQQAALDTVDVIYECGIFHAGEFFYGIFFIPIRDTWRFLSFRWNDVVEYLREGFTNLVDDISAITDFASLTGIGDFIHILYEFAIYMSEWFIHVPSIYVPILTPLLQRLLFLFNCISDIIVDFLISLLKLTILSESCSFCSYEADEKGRHCGFMHVSVDGVVPDCNQCHQFQCRFTDCVIDFYGFAFSFFGDGFTNFVIDAAACVCCFLTLWRRPLFIFMGFIDYELGNHCVAPDDIGPELLKWFEDILGCFNTFLQLITGGRFDDFFSMLFAYVLKDIAFIVDGIKEVRNCFSNPPVSTCFSSFPDTCNFGGHAIAIGGLQTCITELDSCFQPIEFMYPINYIHLMKFIYHIFQFIDTVACSVEFSISCFEAFPVCKGACDGSDTSVGRDLHCWFYCVASSFSCIQHSIPLFWYPALGLYNVFSKLTDIYDWFNNVATTLVNQVHQIIAVIFCFDGECVHEGFKPPFLGGIHRCSIDESMACIYKCFTNSNACDNPNDKRSVRDFNVEDLFTSRIPYDFYGDAEKDKVTPSDTYIPNLYDYNKPKNHFTASRKRDGLSEPTQDDANEYARQEWLQFLESRGVDASQTGCGAILSSKFVTQLNLDNMTAGDYMSHYSCLFLLILGSNYQRDYGISTPLNNILGITGIVPAFMEAKAAQDAMNDPTYTDTIPQYQGQDQNTTESSNETETMSASMKRSSYYGDSRNYKSNRYPRRTPNHYGKTFPLFSFLKGESNPDTSLLHKINNKLIVYGSDSTEKRKFSKIIFQSMWSSIQSSPFYRITQKFVNRTIAIQEKYQTDINLLKTEKRRQISPSANSNEGMTVMDIDSQYQSTNEIANYYQDITIFDPIALIMYEGDISDAYLALKREQYKESAQAYVDFVNEFLMHYRHIERTKQLKAFNDPKRVTGLIEMDLRAKQLSKYLKSIGDSKLRKFFKLYYYPLTKEIDIYNIDKDNIERKEEQVDSMEIALNVPKFNIPKGIPQVPDQFSDSYGIPSKFKTSAFYKKKNLDEFLEQNALVKTEIANIKENYETVASKFNMTAIRKFMGKIGDIYEFKYWPTVRSMHFVYSLINSNSSVQAADNLQKWFHSNQEYFIEEGFVSKQEADRILKKKDVAKRGSFMSIADFNDTTGSTPEGVPNVPGAPTVTNLRKDVLYGPFTLPYALLIMLDLAESLSSNVINNTKDSIGNVSSLNLNYTEVNEQSYNMKVIKENIMHQYGNVTSESTANFTLVNSTLNFNAGLFRFFDSVVSTFKGDHENTFSSGYQNLITRLSSGGDTITTRSFFEYLKKFFTVHFPASVNGTLFYSPFSLPFIDEGAFDWVQPLPNTAFPIDIAYPNEFIKENCSIARRFNGVQSPFYLFKFSDNCYYKEHEFQNMTDYIYCNSCDYCPKKYANCRTDIGFGDFVDSALFLISAIPRVIINFYVGGVDLKFASFVTLMIAVPYLGFINPFLIIPAIFLIQLCFWGVSIDRTTLPWPILLLFYLIGISFLRPTMTTTFVLTYVILSLIVITYFINIFFPFITNSLSYFNIIKLVSDLLLWLRESYFTNEFPVMIMYATLSAAAIYILFSISKKFWYRALVVASTLGISLSLYFSGYLSGYQLKNWRVLHEILQRTLRFSYSNDQAIPPIDILCWFITISNTALLGLVSFGFYCLFPIIFTWCDAGVIFIFQFMEILGTIYLRITQENQMERFTLSSLLTASQNREIGQIRNRYNAFRRYTTEQYSKLRTYFDKYVPSRFRNGITIGNDIGIDSEIPINQMQIDILNDENNNNSSDNNNSNDSDNNNNNVIKLKRSEKRRKRPSVSFKSSAKKQL